MQLIILSRTREKMTYFAVRRNFFSKKMFRIAPLDGTITNDQAIFEHFNEFFCCNGANLADKFNQSAPNSLSQYLEQRVSPSIYLDVPNLSEIINAIQALSLNISIGHDNIPPYYLRISDFYRFLFYQRRLS